MSMIIKNTAIGIGLTDRGYVIFASMNDVVFQSEAYPSKAVALMFIAKAFPQVDGTFLTSLDVVDVRSKVA